MPLVSATPPEKPPALCPVLPAHLQARHTGSAEPFHNNLHKARQKNVRLFFRSTKPHHLLYRYAGYPAGVTKKEAGGFPSASFWGSVSNRIVPRTGSLLVGFAPDDHGFRGLAADRAGFAQVFLRERHAAGG